MNPTTFIYDCNVRFLHTPKNRLTLEYIASDEKKKKKNDNKLLSLIINKLHIPRYYNYYIILYKHMCVCVCARYINIYKRVLYQTLKLLPKLI